MNKDAAFKPTPSHPLPAEKSPLPFSDSLLRLSKICLFLSLPFLLYVAFTAAFSISPDPTSFFALQPSSPLDASCSSAANLSDPTPTRLSHLQFGLAGSAKTWPDRRHYSELWWDPNSTHGFVWLDEKPNSTWLDLLKLNSNSPEYRVTSLPEMKTSDRIARILKESFEMGLPGVRWFVMGDDDTVFFRENLVRVLSKYDHREMYYIGGSSESVEQDVMHGYDTAFGGGGFAVSYPLACEVVRILDGCIERYHNFYGSDEKMSACVAELGVPLTREPGFHQLDVRGDLYGLLAAHPVSPLVSLHHLDYVQPLFPGQNQVESLRRLMSAYNVDPARTLQQSICYDHSRKWSVSVSWGYTVQLYPFLVPSRVLATPLQTFSTWRSWKEGPFMLNTRPSGDPCEKPIVYFLDQVEVVGGGSRTVTTYRRVAADKTELKCNQTGNGYKYAMSVQKIVVSSLKTDPDESLKVKRRQCCEMSTSSWTVRRSNIQVQIRGCKPGETITI